MEGRVSPDNPGCVRKTPEQGGYTALKSRRRNWFRLTRRLNCKITPNGVELVRQIRDSGSNRTIPIVMISGENDPTALAQGFEAGASFFLYKPIDQRSLVRLIRAASGAMEHERRRTRRIPLAISCAPANR